MDARPEPNQFAIIERGASGITPVATTGELNRRRSGMTTARLAEIDLPDFGADDVRPEIPAATYAARVSRLRERADRHGFDRLVVYADREHSANLAYLTGFDPRFEEAILVLGPAGTPAVLVGNECYGLAGAAAAADASGAVPGAEPARPAPRPLAFARGDPRRRRNRDAAAGSGWSAGRPTRAPR